MEIDAERLLKMERQHTDRLFEALDNLAGLRKELKLEYEKLGWLRADTDIKWYVDIIEYSMVNIFAVRRMLEMLGIIDFDDREQQWEKAYIKDEEE